DDGSCFGTAAVVPHGSDFFYAGIDPDYNGTEVLLPLSYYTYWPDMSCCYGNRFYQTAPQIPLVGGQWQEVVYHIKLNTPGQSNGSQTLWVNGVKKIDMQNMRWRTTTDLRANMLRLDNWTSYVTKTEHLWMDDLTLLQQPSRRSPCSRSRRAGMTATSRRTHWTTTSPPAGRRTGMASGSATTSARSRPLMA